MMPRPPRSTRTYPLLPFPTLFRSVERHAGAGRVFFKDHRQRIAGEGGVGIGRTIRLGAAMLLPAERVFQYRRYGVATGIRSEEHTSELQTLMRKSYAVFCLKKKTD